MVMLDLLVGARDPSLQVGDLLAPHRVILARRPAFEPGRQEQTREQRCAAHQEHQPGQQCCSAGRARHVTCLRSRFGSRDASARNRTGESPGRFANRLKPAADSQDRARELAPNR
jgi:hypothetical protein